MVASGEDRVSRWGVPAYIACCLFPVHAILWGALAAGVEPVALQPLKLPFALLPTMSAIGILLWLRGPDAVQGLLERVWVPRVGWRWYVLAIGLFAALAFGAMGIRWTVDGFFPAWSEFASPSRILLMSPFLLLFPGIAEEFGWRGFMQHELQRRWPPFAASVAVGVTWGAWHGMDFLMGNWSSQWPFVVSFAAYITGASVIIGWIFLRSGGSVALAMLAHFGANVVNSFLPLWNTYNGSFLPPLIYIGLIWLTAIGVLVLDPGQRTRAPSS